jgi:hypothetical protein
MNRAHGTRDANRCLVHVYDKLNHVFDWYAFRGTIVKKGTAPFASFTDDVCFVSSCV